MKKKQANTILAITCLGYLAFGILWAAIGPMLNQLSSRNNVSLAAIGSLYSAIFFGAVTAQIVLGKFTDRWGQLRSLTIALFVLGLGFLGVTLSRWLPLTLALGFIAGLGHGIVNLSGNVMVSKLFKEKSVAAVNLVNVFFGIGACIGPALVSVSLSLWNNGLPALWLSVLLILVTALIYLLGFFKVSEDTGSQNVQSGQKMRFTAFLWSVGVMILLYVGAESSMGGWATTYMQKTTTLSIELAALVTSGFWLAITLGRVMGTVLGARISARKVLTLCFVIACAGVLLFVAGYGSTLFSILGIFFVGLGFGAIYPTSMAVVTTVFAKTPGQAGAVVTAMSAVGGMVLPWLQGVIMTRSGIRSGGYMVAAVVAVMVLSFVWSQSLARKSETAPVQ